MIDPSVGYAGRLGDLPNGCQVGIPEWITGERNLHEAARRFHHTGLRI